MCDELNNKQFKTKEFIVVYAKAVSAEKRNSVRIEGEANLRTLFKIEYSKICKAFVVIRGPNPNTFPLLCKHKKLKVDVISVLTISSLE